VQAQCPDSSTTIRATDVLMAEHRIIETVLDAAERMLDRATVDPEFFRKTVEFLRDFADACHHAKEEDALFPALESAGVARENGPLGCMVHEHELGRELIAAVSAAIEGAAAGEPHALATLNTCLRRYIVLLRQHILKEDNILFRMADVALGVNGQQVVLELFRQVEVRNGHGGMHAMYVALADELGRRAGVI
jgi:hemerythrin-like domain-containing protein